MAEQHASLGEDRWSTYSLDQQVLMIGNEMNRGRKLMGPADQGRRRNSYERVLQLTDLTIRTATRPAVRREVLRWRDLIAELYLAEAGRPAEHDAAFRVLLRMTPAASSQLCVLDSRPGSGTNPTS